MLALAQLARLCDDGELLGWVARSYEWVRAQGDARTGFFPNICRCPVWPWDDGDIPGIGGRMDPGVSGQYDNSPQLHGCETAGLADMIGTGLELSRAAALPGAAGLDCWDDVDRWARNMLQAGQLQDTGWVAALPGADWSIDRSVHDPARGDPPHYAHARYSTRDVLGRNRGSWPTAALPNDFYAGVAAPSPVGPLHPMVNSSELRPRCRRVVGS